MNEELRRIFANNLKFALSMNKRTQKELADHMGVSTAIVSEWVNGKKIPRADKLQSISNWLHIDLANLLEEVKNSDRNTVRVYNISIHSDKAEELAAIADKLPPSDVDVLIAYAKRLSESLGKEDKS